MYDPRYIRQKNAEQSDMRSRAQAIISKNLRDPDDFSTFLACGSPCDIHHHHSDDVTVTCNTAGFAHLTEHICDNSFICPCCTNRKMRRRSEEITQIIETAQAEGYYVYLVTHTIRHEADSSLKWLMDNLSAAVGETYRSRAFKELRDQLGVIGWIRCYDIVYKDSTQANPGWHPHFHNLIIMENKIPVRRLKGLLYKQYAYQVDKLTGFDCSWNAFDVRKVSRNAGAAEYITKLKLTQYITKSEKTGSLYPFDLLYMDDDGNMPYAGQFLEFAYATQGVPRVRFSPNLRKKLGMTKKEVSSMAYEIKLPVAVLMALEMHPAMVAGFVEDIANLDSDRLHAVMKKARTLAEGDKTREDDLARFDDEVYEYFQYALIYDYERKTADDYWQRSYDEYFDESVEGEYVDDLAVDFEPLDDLFEF